MGFITARTVFRAVEHFAFEDLTGTASDACPQARDTPAVVLYEWCFCVFEATFMLSAIAVFNLFYPGRFLSSDNKIYLAQYGQTELEGPGWSDKHSFTMTLFMVAATYIQKASHGYRNTLPSAAMHTYTQLPTSLPCEVVAALQPECRPKIGQARRHQVLAASVGLPHHPSPLSLGRVGALLQWPALKEEFSCIARAVVTDQAGVIGMQAPEFHVVLAILLPGLAVKPGMNLPTLQHLFDKATQDNACSNISSEVDRNDGYHNDAATLWRYGLKVCLETAKEPTENADLSAIYAQSILGLLLRIRHKDDYKHMVHWVRDADLFTQVWVFFCTLAFMQFTELEAAYERLSLAAKMRFKMASLLRRNY
ncbi:hypothetical protein PpBr36_02259 [Pyricularia pennisetigena]|uniref:hypothetical protein n=1 Tax=Pyricularia pennisetigena TaxID=1578925 RepID=UPI001152FF1B|nr:hypothetical protein PpBr36_02259 [Pyricularia pennisetigena]TLS30944.1 hypothetical protein PpBr36_02259 [Pyricularia pennisetigena]